MAMFDELPGIACTLVEQPLAMRLMNPDGLKGFDALVLYDMPGLDFAAADRPGYVEPDAAFKVGFLDLLDRGIGIVALHHAIAGWPAWPEYAEFLGGRFLYRPGSLRGLPRSDSGYRHDVVHTIELVDPQHPVLAGLPLRADRRVVPVRGVRRSGPAAAALGLSVHSRRLLFGEPGDSRPHGLQPRLVA
jgi:hypothetical protein